VTDTTPPRADRLTIDELYGVLIARGVLYPAPPQRTWVREIDMFWSNLASVLAERGTCAEPGCDEPATAICGYSNGHLGSESVPRLWCATHLAGERPLVRWAGDGWDWLERSHWAEPGS
jgi:hypothetical protein